MGKGSNTTTVKNNPWPPLQQPLKDIYKSSENLTMSGVGPSVFPGERIAPMSLPTQAALMGATAEAIGGNNVGKPILEQIGSTAQSGGFNAPMSQAATGLAGLASSVGTAPVKNLLQTASSNGVNPWFKDALDYQTNKVADKVNSYFSGRGRYGSGAHNQALGRELLGVRANALMNQFNQDAARKMQANNMLGSWGMGANQALAQVGDAGINNVMGLAQTAPSADKMRFSDFDRLLNVGSNIQNYQQSVMDEAKNIFDEQNDLPWKRLEKWQQIMQPSMIKFGTSSQTNKRKWSPTSLLGVPMMAAGMK